MWFLWLWRSLDYSVPLSCATNQLEAIWDFQHRCVGLLDVVMRRWMDTANNNAHKIMCGLWRWPQMVPQNIPPHFNTSTTSSKHFAEIMQIVLLVYHSYQRLYPVWWSATASRPVLLCVQYDRIVHAVVVIKGYLTHFLSLSPSSHVLLRHQWRILIHRSDAHWIIFPCSIILCKVERKYILCVKRSECLLKPTYRNKIKWLTAALFGLLWLNSSLFD